MNKIKIKTPNYLGGLKSIVVLTSGLTTPLVRTRNNKQQETSSPWQRLCSWLSFTVNVSLETNDAQPYWIPIGPDRPRPSQLSGLVWCWCVLLSIRLGRPRTLPSDTHEHAPFTRTAISDARLNQRMSNGRELPLSVTSGFWTGVSVHVRALAGECRMNGGLWGLHPKNPLFSGYNFLSSNLKLAFKRGG